MFFVDTLAEMGKFMDSGGNVLWMIVIWHLVVLGVGVAIVRITYPGDP